MKERAALLLIFITLLLTSCSYLVWESPILDGPFNPIDDDDDDDDFEANLSIDSLNISGDNSVVSLRFNRSVYSSSDESGALTKDDFAVNLASNSGGVSNVSINSVSHSAGGTIANLYLNTTGNSFGVEVLSVSSKDNASIYDSEGLALDPLYKSPAVQLYNSYITGYTKRRKVTINGSMVTGNSPLVDFPLYLTYTSTELLQRSAGGLVESPDGYDILFTGPDGVSPLTFEIDSYDSVTGTLTAWVKMPALYPSFDTFFYIYYGNSSISSSQESRSATWSGGYRAVWHLNESSGGANSISDSGPNGFHGTDQGGLSLALNGKISKAAGFDGFDDMINLGTNDIIDTSAPFTFSAWLYINHAPILLNDYAVWDRRGGFELNSFTFNVGDYISGGDSRLKVSFSDNSLIPYWSDHYAASHISTGQWVYASAVYDGSNINFYINGSPNGIHAYTPAPFVSGYGQSIGGSLIGPGHNFKGMIDELRISNISRSPGWIAAEYSNQNSPSTFYNIGPTEIAPTNTN